MKKRFTAVVMGLLLLILLIPSTAFADSMHKVDGDLKLTDETHSGKTLEKDGYEWDADTNTLTIQDLTVNGTVYLPNKDCEIKVKGKCSATRITRENAPQTQAVTVTGESGATLQGNFDVDGDLTIKDLAMSHGELRNAMVNFKYKLTLVNSDITLNGVSWQTDAGIELVNSSLTVVMESDIPATFTTEKISMDEKSVIESHTYMFNYGKFTPEQQGLSDDYVALPEGGSFANTRLFENATDVPLTVVDKDGNAARHFVLKAPGQSAEKCQIGLKASPAEGGTVSGAGEYDCDTSAAVKAVANKGYHFVRWEDWQGNVVSKDTSYSFTVKESTTLTAVFAKDGATPSQSGGTDQNTDKGTAPKTGDNAHPAIWIALLAVSVLGVAAVAVFGRKHASQKK